MTSAGRVGRWVQNNCFKNGMDADVTEKDTIWSYACGHPQCLFSLSFLNE